MGKDDGEQCDRSSVCHWVSGANAYCLRPDFPQQPFSGCCTIADTPFPHYAWIRRCREFDTVRECHRVQDQNDDARFSWWSEAADKFRCRSSKTSTTTEAPGCCRSISMETVEFCSTMESCDRCDVQRRCHWLETDDSDDCVLTITSTTTTTSTKRGRYGIIPSRRPPLDQMRRRGPAPRHGQQSMLIGGASLSAGGTTNVQNESMGFLILIAMFSCCLSQRCRALTFHRRGELVDDRPACVS